MAFFEKLPASDLQPAAAGINRNDTDTAAGDGAGFVKTHHTDRAQGFQSVQLSDGYMVFLETFDAHSQIGRSGGGKRCGHGRCPQGQGYFQRFQQAESAPDPQTEHEGGGQATGQQQLARETSQLFDKWGLRGKCLGSQGEHLAVFSVYARGHNHRESFAAHYQRSHKDHVALIRQRPCDMMNGQGGFVHRNTFTGKGRFVQFKIRSP